MVTLLQLKWIDSEAGKDLLSSSPAEVGEKAADLFLKNAKKQMPYPTFIELKDAARFGIDLTIEDTGKAPKAKSAPRPKPEVKNEVKTEVKPVPAPTKEKPVIKSVEDLEAEKQLDAEDKSEDAEGSEN